MFASKECQAALAKLGLAGTPNKEEICKARREIIRNNMKMHSDKVQGENEKKEADKKMQELNAACNLLLDELEKPPKMPLSPEEQKRREESTMRYLKDRFGSHLCPEGSRRVLYLFAALEDERFEEAKCLLLVKREDRRDKYVENINKKERPQNGDEDKALLHYLTQSACNNPIVEMVESDCNNLSVGKAYRNLGRNWQALFKETLQKRRGTDNAVETNISDKYGVTPMHIAARHGRTDLMTILIDHGADVNVLDNAQRSPLDEAADKNYVKAVKFLLDNKDVTISKNVRTNVDQKKYSPEMIAMFLDHPSFKTKNQITAESCKGNATNPVTLKPTPKPTIIPGSTLKNDQNNGQAALAEQGLAGNSTEAEGNSTKAKIENILDNPEVAEVLPENTAIAFHWLVKEYKTSEEHEISIGEKNIERVKKFSKLEPERAFYVVVHGLCDKQVKVLEKSFEKCLNVKVLNFKSLKLDDQYDLLIGCKENGENRDMKLSQYWNDMYSKKVTQRMNISNEIDLMKYHLAVSADQIVGPDKPLAVFDFDTLLVEGKKIGEVKIIKGGVLLACLPEDVSTVKQRTLDLPILAVSQGGNEIFKTVRKKIQDNNTRDNFFNRDYVAHVMIEVIKYQNILKLLKMIGIGEHHPERNKMVGEMWDKANQLFAFNRDGIVIIASDKSWHDKENTSTPTQQQQPTIESTLGGNQNGTQEGITAIPESTFNGNQNNGQGSSGSPKETVTSKPTPGPTIIPGSTVNGNQNNGQGSSGSPKETVTSKPTPGPTIIPGNTVNGNQNNGQGSSGSPKETVTSKPTPGPTIIPGSTFNSNQNGTSKTSIITQSSSSDNSQSNNNTRSLLIGLAIAGAMAGALTLYFLAPLILSVSIGVGAQLGLGIVGAGVGAAIGGGIGYLTDVAISCCSSKAHAA